MNRLARTTVLLLAATALGAAAGVSVAADRMKVRMGTEGAYPPFNNIDSNGELVGFDIDIGNAICEVAELDCEWVVQDWDGIIPGLLAEKYDTILASMSITDERREKVAFTDKYYNSPARFVVPEADAGSIGDSVDALKQSFDGKTVGVQSSTIFENYLNDTLAEVITLKTYDTQEAANLDLAAGRIDAVLADSIVLNDSFLATELGEGFVFAGPTLSDPRWFGEGAGIAVRKEDTELLDALNKAIAEIRANGTYKNINDKYFDFDIYGD